MLPCASLEHGGVALFFIFAETVAMVFIHGEDELVPQAVFAIR